MIIVAVGIGGLKYPGVSNGRIVCNAEWNIFQSPRSEILYRVYPIANSDTTINAIATAFSNDCDLSPRKDGDAVVEK